MSLFQDEVALELREYFSRATAKTADCTASILSTSPLKMDPECPRVLNVNQEITSAIIIKQVTPAATIYPSPNHEIPTKHATPNHAISARQLKVKSPTSSANPMEKKSPPAAAKYDYEGILS